MLLIFMQNQPLHGQRPHVIIEVCPAVWNRCQNNLTDAVHVFTALLSEPLKYEFVLFEATSEALALIPAFMVRSWAINYFQLLDLKRVRAREGLAQAAQPRAWSEGDVSAGHCLYCEAGELGGVTRARQARPLSACTAH